MLKRWAFADIAAAANKTGIVARYKNNSFMLTTKITREEMQYSPYFSLFQQQINKIWCTY